MDKLIIKTRVTFKNMGKAYKNIFKFYYPSHRSNGFTERNQTFNFAHNYLTNNSNAVIWQELPVNNGHIDTIIIDNKLKVVLFIEAKRITNSLINKKLKPIKDDMDRLCANGFTRTIPQGKLIHSYKHYILYLVDIWYNENETVDETLTTRKSILTNWKEKAVFFNWTTENSNVKEIDCGIYEIGKPSTYKIKENYKKNNTEFYNIMYRLYSLSSSNAKAELYL